jgi:phosphatidylglycerol:prolipoprotein diacylglycerol transferase
MEFDPYGIHIGFLHIRYYGMIIMFGALMAAYLARWMLKKMGKDGDIVWDALIWVLIFGVIGARLYHVFTPSKFSGITTSDYLGNPLLILSTWQGGLGMPGAIVGGAIGLYIFTRRRNLSFGMMADIAAPGVALAQAIGRWGNFVNQELYGPPTDLPWGIFIRPENRAAAYAAYETFHPLFLYESIWNLGNALLLLFLWNRYYERMKAGDLFLIYLLIYALGRFFLEFIRLDFVPLYGINLNQGLMLLVGLVSGVALIFRHRASFRRA